MASRRAELLQVRLTAVESRAYRYDAERRGLTLSEWVRAACALLKYGVAEVRPGVMVQTTEAVTVERPMRDHRRRTKRVQRLWAATCRAGFGTLGR